MSHDLEALIRAAAAEPHDLPDTAGLLARGARRRRRRRTLSAVAATCLLLIVTAAALRPLLAPDESRVVLDRADPPATAAEPTAPAPSPSPSPSPSPRAVPGPSSPSPSPSAPATADEEPGPGRTVPAPAPRAPDEPAPAPVPDAGPAPAPLQPQATAPPAVAPPGPEPAPEQTPAPLCPAAAVNVVPVFVFTHGGGPVTVQLIATPDRACQIDMTVQATLFGDGEPLDVVGNPGTARLRSAGAGREVVAEAIWDQWCGDPDLGVSVRVTWPGNTTAKSGSTPECQSTDAPSSLGPFQQRGE